MYSLEKHFLPFWKFLLYNTLKEKSNKNEWFYKMKNIIPLKGLYIQEWLNHVSVNSVQNKQN